MGANTYTKPAALELIRQIMALIAQRPRTIRYLATQTGRADRTIRGYMEHLTKTGQAHIAAWPRERGLGKGRRYQAAFLAGPGENVPKPPPIPPQQLVEEYRQRARKNPEKYPGYHRAKQRSHERNTHHNRMAMLKNIPDPMVRAAVANGMADPRPYYRRLTPQESLEVARLREQGWTYRQIGHHFGISWDAAKDHCAKHARKAA